MRATLYHARHQLQVALRERGQDVAALLDVTVDREDYTWRRLIFRARFTSGQPRGWIVYREELQADLASFPSERAYARAVDLECRSLYSRLLEDHLLELELAPRRQTVIDLERSGARADVVYQAHLELAEFQRHVRRHHRAAPVVFGVDYGRLDATAVTTFNAQAEPPELLVEQMRQQLARDIDRAFGVPRHLLDPGEPLGEFGTAEARERGLALLKSWLTPEQLASYEAQRHFEVRGSDSGKRYRIRHGRQMNIDELDAAGEKVCGWCFLPEGGLVAGDIMLAQKIALETNETAALKVANRFGAGPSIDMRPGAVNYVPPGELARAGQWTSFRPLTREQIVQLGDSTV